MSSGFHLDVSTVALRFAGPWRRIYQDAGTRRTVNKKWRERRQMKKLGLLFLLLAMLACEKAPVTTTGTPTFTTDPQACDGKYFPSGSPSCCQVGNDQNGGEEWHVIDMPGKNGLGH